MITLEQQARDLLERMCIEGAQSFSAGEVVELANMIAEMGQLKALCFEAAKLLDDISNTDVRDETLRDFCDRFTKHGDYDNLVSRLKAAGDQPPSRG